jgi:7-carboxy-7-deazaguanine synthase
MRIAEVFCSLQGEGLLTGTPSVFIRTSGCNLRCAFCDTPYASWEPEGEEMSVSQIVERVASREERHVVLTGGEPMIFLEATPLTRELRRLGRHITIETAGTRHQPVECDLMSISPKLSNSTPITANGQLGHGWVQRHDQRRIAPEVIRRLVREYVYQFKFVVESLASCAEVERYLAGFPEIDRCRVMLMPEGTDPKTLRERADWLEPYCREHGLLYCPRKQIEWYGLQRGT